MGVKGLILLQRSQAGAFRAGQPLKGILKYSLDKPTKFTSIDISLVGKGKCQWSETDADDSTTYYSNKEDYVKIIKNVLAGRTNQKIEAGTYECLFELFLPENIPTSFKNKICTIAYKIIATFVKDNFFGTKDKFEEEVTVYGYVDPCSPEPLIFGLQKDLLTLSSNNNIEVKAEIERTFVTPGENIKMQLKVINDSDVPVTIKTELMKYFTYVSSNKRKKIDKETVETTKDYSPSLKENSVSKLTCVVPTLPSLYSIQHTKVMIGEYKVKVTLKLPFPHINATVEVPVVIGERRGHLGATVVGSDDGNPSTSKMSAKGEKEETVAENFEKYDSSWQDLKGQISSEQQYC